MRKLMLLTLAFFLIALTSRAQTITISGTVKTQDGDALHLAFVQDKTYKTGAYTDSTGYFSLSVYPNSRLGVKCFGFRDTIIPIDNRTLFTIVLRPNVNITASRGIQEGNTDPANLAAFRDVLDNYNTALSGTELRVNHPLPWKGEVKLDNGTQVNVTIVTAKNVDLINSLNANPSTRLTAQGYGSISMTPSQQLVGPDMAQGAIFPVFNHKEATQGSRYLFDNWVHGYIIGNNDSLIQSQAFVFNYDKIGGTLFLSKDRHAAIELYKTSFKSFTLFDNNNQPYTFTMVPQIDKNHYVQVISSCSDYAIFKLIKTRFVTADYTTDGVASSGNDYDSYQNEETYYIMNTKTGQLQKLSLRKKALKEAFAGQAAKLNKFMAQNSGDIDDAYLANLCQFINAK